MCISFYSSVKKNVYRFGLARSYRAPVPVIVVGNLSVGGTGKTPMVIYIVEKLLTEGLKPAVISRGYHGNAENYPLTINAQTPVVECGDEPLMIYRRTGVPIVIGPNREASIKQLLKQNDVNVIISDDGLQQFALQRDIEICLIDKTNQSNNHYLLPAGPNRESIGRLKTVDYVIEHVFDDDYEKNYSGSEQIKLQMVLKPSAAKSIGNNKLEPTEWDVFAKGKIHAVAGIGNPERFFLSCEKLNYKFIKHSFPDHHNFVIDDINFDDELGVLMTEKDAVKCASFATSKHWYLPVDVNTNKLFITDLINRINKLVSISS